MAFLEEQNRQVAESEALLRAQEGRLREQVEGWRRRLTTDRADHSSSSSSHAAVGGIGGIIGASKSPLAGRVVADEPTAVVGPAEGHSNVPSVTAAVTPGSHRHPPAAMGPVNDDAGGQAEAEGDDGGGELFNDLLSLCSVPTS